MFRTWFGRHRRNDAAGVERVGENTPEAAQEGASVEGASEPVPIVDSPEVPEVESPLEKLTPDLAYRLVFHPPDTSAQIADDDWASPEDRELSRLGLLDLSIGRAGSYATLTDDGRRLRSVIEAELEKTDRRWPEAFEKVLLALRTADQQPPGFAR